MEAKSIIIIILCVTIIILSLLSVLREKAYQELADEWAKDKVEKFALESRIEFFTAQQGFPSPEFKVTQPQKVFCYYSSPTRLEPDESRREAAILLSKKLEEREDLLKILETEEKIPLSRYRYKAEIWLIPYKEEKQ